MTMTAPERPTKPHPDLLREAAGLVIRWTIERVAAEKAAVSTPPSGAGEGVRPSQDHAKTA